MSRRSRRAPRSGAPLPVLLVVALAMAACTPGGPDDGSTTPDPDPTVTLTVEPTPDPTPGATPRDGGPEPVGAASTDARTHEDFPRGGGEVALLTAVRVAGQPGFDRVVWEFDGPDPATYSVRYEQPPIRAAGSGHEVEIEGEAFIVVALTPASGVDLRGERAERTYEGPDRVRAAGTALVTEVVHAGDFEAHLDWAIGLQRRAPFALTWLENPLRLVIDIIDEQ